MITFITDQRPGEPDIIRDVAHYDLTIHNAFTDAELDRIAAPSGGWTHQRLQTHTQALHSRFDPELPLDARLGGSFVGSTEI